jgi:hypothetical protein
MVKLESLGRVLKSRPVWQASYYQEYLPAGMTMGDEERGTVWVSWPDRAQFQSGEPVVRTMGLDGRHVRLLDVEVPSCDDHRLDDDEWARIPLAAVLDPQQAVDNFSILDHGSAGFVLIPHEPGGVARLEVVLRSDNLPEEVIVIDPQGATNRFRFDGWESAEEPPGGRWLPEVPPEIECVTDVE